MKSPTSYRLSDATLRLIAKCAKATELSKTDVVSQAVRLYAEKQGVK